MVCQMQAIPRLAEVRAHPGFDAVFVYEPNLRAQQKGRAILKLTPSQLAEAVQLSRKLEEALPRLQSPYPLMATTCFLSLVFLLCEAYVSRPGKAQQSLLRVGEAIRYLEENWKEQPDYEQLASVMHVSVATFYRLFKQATGCTPATYLNRVRVAEACKQLGSTDDTIAAVTRAVGFEDSNYFSRVFQKYEGMSPRAYRKSLHGKYR
jgi:AraC-like DNA-binding protein